MSETKLLPCPFCDGEAEFYRTTTRQNFRWSDCVGVRCKTCGASYGTVLYDARIHANDEEYYEAEKAWNTRKPLERIVERLEEAINYVNEAAMTADEADFYPLGKESGIMDAIKIVKEEGGIC